MAHLNGYLYIIGGLSLNNYFRTDYLSLVEKFHLKSRTWTNASSLTYGRSNHESIVFMEKIYVVGGYSRIEAMAKSVEIFDEKMDSWAVVKSMGEGRSFFGLVSVGDSLIAFGGRGPLCSVEILSTENGNWTENKGMQMSECKSDFGYVLI